MSEDDDLLGRLEKTIGYAFKDRALLELAVTAPSYRAEHHATVADDNQRLEFLGDAVFGLLSAQDLFRRYPEADEGDLTVRRSRVASGRALAHLARKVGMGQYLRLGKGDEVEGARDRDRWLTDAMEAVFGAAWCDDGLDAVQAVYDTLMGDGGDAVAPDPWGGNPKGKLQELAQHHAWPDSPAYELIEASGPDHAPEYTVTARMHGGYEARGTGRTKRAAEVAAATVLLRILAEAGFTND